MKLSSAAVTILSYSLTLCRKATSTPILRGSRVLAEDECPTCGADVEDLDWSTIETNYTCPADALGEENSGLGWNQVLWDGWVDRCSETPESEKECWQDLNNKRNAAMRLCYDKNSWDGKSNELACTSPDPPPSCNEWDFSETDWYDVDYVELEAVPCAIEAMKALGWTREMWDCTGEDGCCSVPSSEQTCWDGLNENEQCWASYVDFSSQNWNVPSGVVRIRELDEVQGERHLNCKEENDSCEVDSDCCESVNKYMYCEENPRGKPVCVDDSAFQRFSCFSRDSLVEVLGKGPNVPIHQVEVGDKVRTTNGFSDVYGFGQRDHETATDFLAITLASSDVIELSREHMLFVGKKQDALTADDVKVGDELMLFPSKELSKVISIDSIVKKGAYHPYTYDGTIVVNGILASVYDAEPFPVTVDVAGVEVLNIHQFKNLMYAPLRLMCKHAPETFCGPKNHFDDDGAHHWVEFIANLEYLLLPNGNENDEQNFMELSAYLPVRLLVFFSMLFCFAAENITAVAKVLGFLGVFFFANKVVKVSARTGTANIGMKCKSPK